MRSDETLVLKEVSPDEVDTLLDFVASYFAFDGIPFHSFDVRQSLEQLLRNPSLGKAWFLQVNGKPAGYAVLTKGFDHEVGGRIGTITDFYLQPAFRGRGIGTETLQRIEKEAVTLGLEALELQVGHDNEPAKRLYRKIGFEAANRIPMCKRIGAIRG
jgi:ribosomal protein S18 acetylase RimI-like enzyme